MEFRFDINPLLKTHIVRVTNNLIPQGFTGDRRSVIDAAAKISEIINELGEASARAQGLSKPVTTAQKLRNSDHIVYLLSEKTGKNGCVTGLLKVGTKNLYVFDENGETKMVSAPCVLDFYIHESRQRAGLGKEMFEAMLARENFTPQKMAIDRPSDKLVAFLRKHYGLVRTIPQMNNFVVYEGFFDSQPTNGKVTDSDEHQIQISASPNTALFGPLFKSTEHNKIRAGQQNAPNLPFVQHSPMGRFGAKRPTCSMAEIIHSAPTSITSEPHSTQYDAGNVYSDQQKQQPSDQLSDIDTEAAPPAPEMAEPELSKIDYDKSVEDIIADIESVNLASVNSNGNLNLTSTDHDHHHQLPSKEVKFDESSVASIHEDYKKPSRFQHTKQHTGLKNISFNVGAAVSPTDKMEFDQEAPESFGVVKINRPIGKLSPNIDNSDAISTVSSANSEGLTEQGYFDLKFYHNKLW